MDPCLRIKTEPVTSHEMQHEIMRYQTERNSGQGFQYNNVRHLGDSMNTMAVTNDMIRKDGRIPQDIQFAKASQQMLPMTMTSHRNALNPYVFEAPRHENLINELLDCNSLLDITEDNKLSQLYNTGKSMFEFLCTIGDGIVSKFVRWTKQLPFYEEVSPKVHSNILTSKWHELLSFIAMAHTALSPTENLDQLTYKTIYDRNMSRLLCFLNHVSEKSLSMENLDAEVGELMGNIARITASLCQLRVTRSEYVCLQIILLLNQGRMWCLT